MKAQEWVTDQDTPRATLLIQCGVLALILEFALVTAAGWDKHWLAHPQKTTGQDDSRFIEAQVFQMPKQAHLVDEKRTPALPPRHETVLSKSPSQGRASKPSDAPQKEENQTQAGPKISNDHGPIAVYAPPPSIPSYLQNQDIQANVLIDFFVSSLGTVTPRLVSSSGNEELDALALASVKKWQFRPAEKQGKALDSKVRLRIVFEVK